MLVIAGRDPAFVPGVQAFTSGGRTAGAGSLAPCPVPRVEQLDLNIIPDCELLDVPAPFFEAPVQVPIPPVPPMGCHPILFDVVVAKVGKDDPLRFDARFDALNGDYCSPNLSFDLQVPFACPTFNVTVNSVFDVNRPRLSVTPRTANNAPSCAFDVNLNLPNFCSSINVSGGSASASSGGISLTVGLNRSGSGCNATLTPVLTLNASSISTNITNLTTQVTNITTQITNLTTRITQVETRITQLVTRIDQLETRIQALENAGGTTTSLLVSETNVSGNSISVPSTHQLFFRNGLLITCASTDITGSITFQDCP